MLRALLLIALALPSFAQYFPPAGPAWQKRPAQQLGFDPAKLQAALAFALQSESSWDFAKDQVRTFGRPLGPLPEKRAHTNLLILRRGYILAELGDTLQPDPMYSAAKSFLSLSAGIAKDRALFRSAQDPVRLTIHDGAYDSPHNSSITWEHHLRQTSEWEGELFGKPSTFLGTEEFGAGARQPRAIQPPGSFYEYNDVRVNRLSLSLLTLFRQSLGDILKQSIMDPIGASTTWTWHGYRNSSVSIDGRSIPSVPGGTRWGGGLWMNTRDMARVGLLVLNNGQWNNRQLISKAWLQESIQSSSRDYGYLWWLNTQGKQWPSAPKSAFAAVGNGANIIFIDPTHQLIVVWRWYHTSALDPFLAKLYAALTN